MSVVGYVSVLSIFGQIWVIFRAFYSFCATRGAL